MKVRTLYLDTSVIGGCFDDEWKEATRELFRLADAAVFWLVTSVVAVRELVNAPEEVRRHFASAFSDDSDDARHVAIATIHEVGVVVSWNFHHLANLRREAGFNGVNLLRGCSGAYRVTTRIDP